MHVALPKSRSEKLPAAEQRLGFLAASRDPSIGYVGGYLITSARGRPIEFHYTTPINPSPTHRILYGTELEPYVLGELIGTSLLKQATVEASYILTDQRHILTQRKQWSCPIILVAAHAATTPDSGPATPPELQAHPEFAEDLVALERWLQEVNPGLNLDEPFIRVREAIREVLNSDGKSQAA